VTMLWILLLPVGLIILGAALNQAAVIANHDAMPVQANEARVMMMSNDSVTVAGKTFFDPRHSVMTADTRLKVLCDVFDFGDSISSIGDLLIDFGGWLWAFAPYVWGALVCLKLISYEP
jgi:hypothetical protein